METIVNEINNLECVEENVSHVLYCKNISDLDKINDAQYNIASLKRCFENDLSLLFESIKQKSNFHFSQTGETDVLLNKLYSYFLACNLNQNDTLDLFISDIKLLIDTFLEINQSKQVKLMLSVVNTNMCRLFHTDMNDLRLLCTYNGKGTLWIKNNNVKNLNELSKTNESIFKNQDEIQEALPFEVLILKGALNTSNDTHAIYHRSPTIEETGSSRILLRLDTNCTLFDEI
jgi:hypothetical protein